MCTREVRQMRPLVKRLPPFAQTNIQRWKPSLSLGGISSLLFLFIFFFDPCRRDTNTHRIEGGWETKQENSKTRKGEERKGRDGEREGKEKQSSTQTKTVKRACGGQMRGTPTPK